MGAPTGPLRPMCFSSYAGQVCPGGQAPEATAWRLLALEAMASSGEDAAAAAGKPPKPQGEMALLFSKVRLRRTGTQVGGRQRKGRGS